MHYIALKGDDISLIEYNHLSSVPNAMLPLSVMTAIGNFVLYAFMTWTFQGLYVKS